MQRVRPIVTMFVAGLIAGGLATVTPVEAAVTPAVPSRILDTRSGVGGVTGVVGPGQVVRVAAPAAAAGASSLALNVTATDALAPGFVTVWSCDEAKPATSNLNFVPGRAIPNMAIIRPSTAAASKGQMCLEASAPVHLLVDVMGWFSGTGDVAPTAPNRIVDTRQTGDPLQQGEFRRVRVAGTAGVPANASAALLNVTLTGTREAGFASVVPCPASGGSIPPTSTLNFAAGDTVPAFTIATLVNGDVCVYSNSASNLIVDTFGWAPSAGGLRVKGPERVLDTRNGIWSTGPARNNDVVRVRVAGRGGIPNDSLAALLTVTVSDTTTSGFVTAWPCDVPKPNTSVLNFWAGSARANSVLVGLSTTDGDVCLSAFTNDGSNVSLIADAVGWVPATTVPLPPAGVGAFPVAVDGSGRRLLDQNGNPYVGVWDTGWAISAMLNEAQIDVYLEGIAALGFNGSLVTVPEGFYSRNSPASRNANGVLPFTGVPFQSSLNDAYWRTIDHMVVKAASLGITLLMTPQYLGFANDGWAGAIGAAYGADPQNLTRYGEALAARYGSFANIVWLIGHDRDPISASELNGSVLIARALQANTAQLVTIGGGPNLDPDQAWGGSIAWDFTTVYDYRSTPGAVTKAVHSAKASPCIWLEGIYEDDQGSGLGALIHRRQMWEPIMAGASAAVFGNSERWQFSSDVYTNPPAGGSWQQSLTTAPFNRGSVHVSHLAALLAAEPALAAAQPDHTNTFLTAGTGFARFSTAIGVAYQTAAASITLDTTELGGTGLVRIRRYDPTNGTYTTVAAGEPQSSRVISHPGRNAAGDNDWVYIVDLT